MTSDYLKVWLLYLCCHYAFIMVLLVIVKRKQPQCRMIRGFRSLISISLDYASEKILETDPESVADFVDGVAGSRLSSLIFLWATDNK